MLQKIVTVSFLAPDGDEAVFDRAMDTASDFIHEHRMCCEYDAATVSGNTNTRRVAIGAWDRHDAVDGIIRWANYHYRDVHVQIEYEVY